MSSSNTTQNSSSLTKENPFLPFPQRFLAIIHLCIAFTVFLWCISEPFTGEYFSARSKMLIYEYAMGTADVFKTNGEQKIKGDRNIEWFTELPKEQQKIINEDYNHFQSYIQRPFFQKLSEGIYFFLFDTPPLKLLWIIFSIVIPILLLLRFDGAHQAAWILPLLTCCFIFFNFLYGQRPLASPENTFFPSEKKLIEVYGIGTLTGSPSEQKKQLENAWKKYLIDQWLDASFLNGNKIRDKQETIREERAEFNFTIARINALHLSNLSQSLKESSNPRLSLFQISAYLCWNFLFAFVTGRSGLRLVRNNP